MKAVDKSKKIYTKVENKGKGDTIALKYTERCYLLAEGNIEKILLKEITPLVNVDVDSFEDY